MAWWIQPREIADAAGKGTGKWRMTAESDEDGGGPFGNPECFHDSADEAAECVACDEYTSGVSGFPSRKKMAAHNEARDRAEFDRLKDKFEPNT